MEKVAKTQHVSNTARQRTDELKEFVRSEVKAQLQNQLSSLVWNAGELGDLRRRFPKPQGYTSSFFELRGIGPLTICLHPCGNASSKDGKAAVFLYGPAGFLVKAGLSFNSGW